MQLHMAKPNEILHFAFLHIALSREEKFQYVLLPMDDLSGNQCVLTCRTADDASVDALMRWFEVFSVLILWILDKGSHFNNDVVRQVQKGLKAKHHFTTALCP
jgi:hypothetical protein